jgi:hypothetical protein
MPRPELEREARETEEARGHASCHVTDKSQVAKLAKRKLAGQIGKLFAEGIGRVRQMHMCVSQRGWSAVLSELKPMPLGSGHHHTGTMGTCDV